MANRTSSEIVSNLPHFEAKASQEYKEWLIVTCPREDCGKPFMVRRKDWMAPLRTTQSGRLITGRACPYCFRVALLPRHRRIR